MWFARRCTLIAALVSLAWPPLGGPWRGGGEATIVGRCERSAEDELGVGSAFASTRLWSADGGLGGASGCHAVLTGISARAEVTGASAHVLANYTYANDQGITIEDATLVITLPTGAVLMSFGAEVTGHAPLRGEVRTKAEGSLPATCPRSVMALGFYEAASQHGTHRIPVGRIARGETVVASLEYATELFAKPRSAGHAALQLTVPVPASARRRPKEKGKAAGGISTPFQIDLHVVAPVSSSAASPAAAIDITTPTSDVSIEVRKASSSGEKVGDVAAVLHSTNFQDVLIEISQATEEVGSSETASSEASFSPDVFLQKHPQTGLLAAALVLPTVVPPISSKEYEFVLVLDRSASMRGLRLNRVHMAAHTFLRSIPRGARANLVGFSAAGSALASAFPVASRELDYEAFTALEQHIEAVGGGSAVTAASITAGGSFYAPGSADAAPKPSDKVADALSLVFKDLTREDSTQLRVIFITDRHPSDSDESARLVVERCRDNCRFSVIGIGWGASPQFVEGTSKAGKGSAAFVAERGGVAALEKTLVAQMEDALQPMVSGVDVDWGSLWASASGGNAATGKQVHLLPESGKGSATDSHQHVQSFSQVQTYVDQGGSREIQPAPIDPPIMSKGGRLLAMAFLGHPQDLTFSGSEVSSLRVQARVGGKCHVTQVPVPLSQTPLGSALHALVASRLSTSLEREVDGSTFAGPESRTGQLQALGLAYRIATRETQWVVPSQSPDASGDLASRTGSAPGDPATGNGATAKAVYCAAVGNFEASPSIMDARSSDVYGHHSLSDDVGSSASSASLSVRRPPPAGMSKGQSPTLGVSRSGSLLSVLDFTSLGSSMALRQLTPRSNPPLYNTGTRWGTGLLDSTSLGSTLSVRSFLPFARTSSILDLMHLGASLSLKSGFARTAESSSKLNDLSKPWWQNDVDWAGDSERFNNKAHGSRSQGIDAPSQVGTRDASRLGTSLSVNGPSIGASHLVAQLSVLDFAEMGASLSLRVPQRPSSPYAGYQNRLGSLSMLDCLFLGASLSLGRHALSQRSMPVFGAQRMQELDDLDFGMPPLGSRFAQDEYDDYYGFGDLYGRRSPSSSSSGRSGTSASSSLSMRSFVQMSSMLSVMERPKPDGQAAAVAAKLSVLDFAALGASLSLRQLAAREIARSAPADFLELASSLSLRGFAGGGPWAAAPRMDGAFGDPYEDDGGFGDPYGYGGWVGGPAASGLGGSGPGRGESSSSPWADGSRPASKAPSSSSTGLPGPRMPSAWLTVTVAGGLLVPVLGLLQTSGGACQAQQEVVRIVWPPGSTDRAPASVRLSASPLQSGGADHPAATLVGELPPPPLDASGPPRGKKSKKKKKDAAVPAENELLLTFHVSQICQLIVRPRQQVGSVSTSDFMGDDSFFDLESPLPLLDADLPELDSAALAPGSESTDDQAASDLRAALQAALAARRTFLPAGEPGTPDGDVDGKAKPTSLAGPLEAVAGEAAVSSVQSAGMSEESGLASAAAAVEDSPQTSAYRALLRAQRFDGAFDLGGLPGGAAAVAGLPALLLEGLSRAWGGGGSGGAAGRAAAHTAVALAALSSRHGSLQSSWSLVAAKARAWLANGPAQLVGCGERLADCIDFADLAVVRWQR